MFRYDFGCKSTIFVADSSLTIGKRCLIFGKSAFFGHFSLSLDLRSSLLTLDNAQASLSLFSLNRSLHHPPSTLHHLCRLPPAGRHHPRTPSCSLRRGLHLPPAPSLSREGIQPRPWRSYAKVSSTRQRVGFVAFIGYRVVF